MKSAALFTLLIPSLLGLAGCSGGGDASTSPPSEPGVVHVIARGLTFEAPARIPSGWVTFRFDNEAPMTHLAVLEHVPDGIGIAEHQAEVAPVFQNGMDFIAAGKPDSAMAAFGTLPAWFHETVFTGGLGLTAPGHMSEATVHLEPGTYLLECYVKTAGVFHSYNPDPATDGMVHLFTVTDSTSGREAPQPTMQLTISGEDGFAFEGEPLAGDNVIAVHFADQKLHENFVGHDVHLAKLAEDADLDALAAWMDWSHPGGLETPAPAEFLGGLQEMPAGSTGYFKVTLTPGRYAWIAEVTHPQTKGMLRTFTVPGETS